MIIVFDFYFNFLWFGATLLFLYYKRYQLNYPKGNFELDFMGMVILITLHYIRLFYGSKGNKTETSSLIVIFILLTLLCIIGNVYYVIL
jgi:hypothetical protein